MRPVSNNSVRQWKAAQLIVGGAVLAGTWLMFGWLGGSTTSAAGLSLNSGREIYMENCAPCHGAGGRGDGVGARVLPVRPADHTNGEVMGTRTDQDLFEVISKGGLGTGKSSFMPAWQGQLTREQILAVIAYIRSLGASTSASGAQKHSAFSCEN